MIVRLCNGCARRFPAAELKRARCRNCQIRKYDQTHKRLRKVVVAQHPYCVDCGATTDLCADHIVPTSRGGANVISNYEVRCRSCNSRRGSEEAVFYVG